MPAPGRTRAFDAIVLAGGAARRLDGADKPGLEVGGVALLDRVVAACAGAGRVVVVGPPRDLPVMFTREDPPGGGPVAAIAAGLVLTAAPLVLVLAADLPWIAPAVPALLAAVDRADVAALVDADGRRNVLAAVWSRGRLDAMLHRVGDTSGVPVRRLFDGVTCRDVADHAGWGRDCDTWADLAAARNEERS